MASLTERMARVAGETPTDILAVARDRADRLRAMAQHYADTDPFYADRLMSEAEDIEQAAEDRYVAQDAPVSPFVRAARAHTLPAKVIS